MRHVPLLPGIAAVAVLALSGCTNGLAERQAELSQWVAKPETQLVAAFGAPNRVYETGGIKFLTYSERNVDVVADGPFLYGPDPWFGPYPGFGPYPYPVTTYYRECDTTFTIVQGVVRAFSLRGNACG